MRRPTANRDQAVILTLLDSCVRASEFCAFRVNDFDPKRGKLEIRHGGAGGAKCGKGRTVYLGKTARHAFWRYLAERDDGEEASAPLFVVRQGRPFNQSSLRHIIKSIAARAGVKEKMLILTDFAILGPSRTCDRVEMYLPCNPS